VDRTTGGEQRNLKLEEKMGQGALAEIRQKKWAKKKRKKKVHKSRFDSSRRAKGNRRLSGQKHNNATSVEK